MKDSIYIKSELDNLRANTIMINELNMPLHQARINMAEWAYNDGNLRTEQEYKNRISNIEEEITALEFAQDIGFGLDIAKAKLNQLNDFYLND